MATRRETIGWIAGSGFFLSGCNVGGSASYHFRMTVEVETPAGLKTGSAIYKVLAEKNNTRLLAEERAGGTVTRGEAVTVDLPGGPLFILLKLPEGNDSLGAVATFALSPDTRRGDIDAYMSAVRSLGGLFGGAKAELPRADWPMMVRFTDIRDPKSIEGVDPDAIGVKRIVVETTDDALTTGIEKKIPWLPRIYQMGIGPDFRPAGIPLGDFKRLFSTEVR